MLPSYGDTIDLLLLFACSIKNGVDGVLVGAAVVVIVGETVIVGVAVAVSTGVSVLVGVRVNVAGCVGISVFVAVSVGRMNGVGRSATCCGIAAGPSKRVITTTITMSDSTRKTMLMILKTRALLRPIT